jgi:ferrous iron transport protein A
MLWFMDATTCPPDPASASLTIDTLGSGRRARVRAVRGEPSVRRRLLEMGMCPGVGIEVIRRAPFGDPIELRVRGYSLSLRAEQAALVLVSPER